VSSEGLVGSILGERLQIEALLGAGGMGAVYRARHLELGRHVAVKVIGEAAVPEAELVARFEREARTMSHLDHPNVVRVLDFGHDGERLYLVMEYVEGESLHAFMAHHAPLDLKTVAELGGQILDGLAAIHRAGLVHRDVKPGNVIVVEREGKLSVKVCDFGLLRSIPRSGAVVGTPSYMAPEQVLGTEVDGATDVYSAGVLLFEMITGRVPFIGSTPVAVLMKHVQEAQPSPRIMRPEIPPELEQLILRAMSKEPELRPSAEEMAARLRAGRLAPRAPKEKHRFWSSVLMLAAVLLVSFAFLLEAVRDGLSAAPELAPGTWRGRIQPDGVEVMIRVRRIIGEAVEGELVLPKDGRIMRIRGTHHGNHVLVWDDPRGVEKRILLEEQIEVSAD
jgi:serine/threonine protein kinase